MVGKSRNSSDYARREKHARLVSRDMNRRQDAVGFGWMRQANLQDSFKAVEGVLLLETDYAE